MKLDVLVARLLEKETIDQDEVYEVVGMPLPAPTRCPRPSPSRPPRPESSRVSSPRIPVRNSNAKVEIAGTSAAIASVSRTPIRSEDEAPARRQ